MKCYVTNGSVFIATNIPPSPAKRTVYFQEAQEFRSPESASNFLIANASKVKGFYIVDCAKREQIDHVIHEEAVSKRKKFNKSERKEIYNKTNGHCALCGKHISLENMTIDHIVPVSKGGTNEMSNLQPTCLVCNRIKQDILPQEFMNKIWEIFLFNMKMHYNAKYVKAIVELKRIRKRKGIIRIMKAFKEMVVC